MILVYSQPGLKATVTVESGSREGLWSVLYHGISQGSARHLVSGI